MSRLSCGHVHFVLGWLGHSLFTCFWCWGVSETVMNGSGPIFKANHQFWMQFGIFLMIWVRPHVVVGPTWTSWTRADIGWPETPILDLTPRQFNNKCVCVFCCFCWAGCSQAPYLITLPNRNWKTAVLLKGGGEVWVGLRPPSQSLPWSRRVRLEVKAGSMP